MKIISNAILLLITAGFFFLSCNNHIQKSTETANPAAIINPGWKMGIALYSFHRQTFTRALAMADSAGVRYVEGFSFYKLDSTFDDSMMGKLNHKGIATMKAMLAEKGIKMTSMYVDGAKTLRDWISYFDLAKAFGLEYLVCEPPKENWDMIDSLAGIYGIKIAIHEHAKGLSAYWHPDSVMAAIKHHSNIGACADLGHWARSGLDPAKCLRILEGHVMGLHLKDVEQSGDPKAEDVIPGKGVIDFTAVANELKRQDFKGYVQVECEHNLDNNLYEVKEALRYFSEISGMPYRNVSR